MAELVDAPDSGSGRIEKFFGGSSPLLGKKISAVIAYTTAIFRETLTDQGLPNTL